MSNLIWKNEESQSYGQEYIEMLVDDIDILLANKEDFKPDDIENTIFPALDMLFALVSHCKLPLPTKSKLEFWQSEIQELITKEALPNEIKDTVDNLISKLVQK